jgi:CBS-domain-containing membrane protein
MGGLLTFLIGILSLLFGRLWLFPSLGPTIFLQTSKPADPSARFYNTAIGHALGALAGFAGVFLFGAYDDPVALIDKQLTAGRMGAAIVAIAFTLLLTLLARADHPPAGATTLLVALGSIQSLQDIFALAVGVIIAALSGELVRLMRTNKAAHISVKPRKPAKDGKL